MSQFAATVIFFQNNMNAISMLRRQENKLFSELSFSGKVLDLGGSKNAVYLKNTAGTYEVTSVNNSTDSSCSVVHDLEKTPLPFESNTFDVVVSNNTLEHIFHARELIDECSRVLNDKGLIVLTVPFMIPYHACPSDFWRYTPDSLELMLTEAGFREIEMQPLGEGVLTSVFHQVERLLPNTIRLGTQLLQVPIGKLDHLLGRLTRLLGKKYDARDYALGFFVTARKS